ncbi:acyl carrier protein phosphodiesterase [Robiginitalea sp. M366]|uniref:acyl carrier protein phosphodiesterase n=1 Tax=Robiginitalea aestuariiviva TaxID=3036903 RepID=UPI00240E382D|nr:acyl carrier protein phosphodiesterase [Robiginitalea aestuariiviva]MDG1572867.1 acyl carrier protein phosphodiesterase [Robiginitalea aestuariiviva]
MNFLAHIYLSFGDADIAIGNFIADSIRGRAYEEYPDRIQQGIHLHRAIDTFTDTHPTTRKSSKRLHPKYSHYSRVIVDIFYDHFLARNWQAYSDTPLEAFVNEFYDLLESRYAMLPPNVQRMMPYMISDNWLLSYAEMDGIARVLEGMNRRTRLRSGMDRAIEDLWLHYDKFETEFQSFFEELVIFSRQKFDTL